MIVNLEFVSDLMVLVYLIPGTVSVNLFSDRDLNHIGLAKK